ncbi:MAG TPA: polysaccharide pyruvyl transferase family protein [Gaiellaceae bacterium]|nr:polysaccharide pyruvyl transferase family protein [Gaiellaceae bacterium]
MEAIRTALDEGLARAIPAGAPVALLDLPKHANVGDHAIALGALAWLRTAGHDVRVLSGPDDYAPAPIRKRLGDGVILLNGGGNLGDLWPDHQRFRERVLADFPDAPVVQLPQSIRFTQERTLDSARRAFGSHGRFTLLVRDRDALQFARAEFDCPVELCPDLAFALGPQRARREPDMDILVLARTDHETSKPFEIEPNGSVGVADWVQNPSLRFRALRALSRYEALSRERFEFGLALLGRGRVVVTDRLHAHILCTLLGTPHVIRDQGYGKLAAFHDAWTRDSPLVERCDTQEEAMAAALRRVG